MKISAISDVHATVDRHRIERYYFRAEPLGQRNADGRLAHGGCAGEKPTIVKGAGHEVKGRCLRAVSLAAARLAT